MRVQKFAFRLIIGIYTVLNAGSFALAGERELINRFEDDAFYYFEIARNLVETGRLTFDGHTITNGFQPLWMIAIIPIFTIVREPIAALRVVGIVSALIAGGTVFACIRYLETRSSLLTRSITFALILYCAVAFGSSGMETTVLMPLILGGFVIFIRTYPWDWSRRAVPELAALGALLALIALARLDAIFFVGVAVGTIAWRTRSTGNWRSVLLIALPVVAAGGAYALWNLAGFGHVIPVSGLAKSAPGWTLNARMLTQFTNPLDPEVRLWRVFSALSLLAIGYFGYWIFYMIKVGTTKGEDYAALVISTAALLMTAYYLVRTEWVLWRWYLYPVFPIGMFVLPLVLEGVVGRIANAFSKPKSIRLLEPLAWILLLVTGFAGIKQGTWPSQTAGQFLYDNYRATQAMNLRYGSEAVYAMGDRAGSFAFFSEGAVLQLEGLVGEATLIDAIREDQLAAYMDDFGVAFVVSQDAPPPGYNRFVLSIPSEEHSFGGRARITLCAEDEVFVLADAIYTVRVWEWPTCAGDSN